MEIIEKKKYDASNKFDSTILMAIFMLDSFLNKEKKIQQNYLNRWNKKQITFFSSNVIFPQMIILPCKFVDSNLSKSTNLKFFIALAI